MLGFVTRTKSRSGNGNDISSTDVSGNSNDISSTDVSGKSNDISSIDISGNDGNDNCNRLKFEIPLKKSKEKALWSE